MRSTSAFDCGVRLWIITGCAFSELMMLLRKLVKLSANSVIVLKENTAITSANNVTAPRRLLASSCRLDSFISTKPKDGVKRPTIQINSHSRTKMTPAAPNAPATTKNAIKNDVPRIACAMNASTMIMPTSVNSEAMMPARGTTISSGRNTMPGRTCPALSVGRKPKTVVTSVPTTRPLKTALGEMTKPSPCRRTPSAEFRSTNTISQPSATPRILPSTPMMNACVRNSRVT